MSIVRIVPPAEKNSSQFIKPNQRRRAAPEIRLMPSKRSMRNFTAKVHSVVKAIPKGTVLTYGEVAQRAGNAKAARAVATIMAKNFNPEIPCHRVIRSDGKLGGYNRGGTEKKRLLLQSEGALV